MSRVILTRSAVRRVCCGAPGEGAGQGVVREVAVVLGSMTAATVLLVRAQATVMWAGVGVSKDRELTVRQRLPRL